VKKFAFFSDFDGTLSNKDFYQIIIDKYITEEGTELFKKWRAKEIKDVDFLGYVFKSINRSEDEILEDILSIPLDSYAKEFIENIKAAGGDFIVLSAGTRYYIERLFEKEGIKDVTIYSNNGVYKDKGIHFDIDTSHWSYSEIYGIDKAKVVEQLKTNYETVYYAGDSEPDIKPSLLADIVFAKNQLKDLLKAESCPFIPFDNFKQIEEYLKKEGVL
jgi:2,3-diketo-5-methylthio-1-phosphopentane phosphatase